MTRRWILAMLCALAAPVAVAAQDTATAEEVIAAGQQAYGPPDTRAKPECAAPQPGGEIVVCGNTEDPAKYRVKSSEDLDPRKTKDVVPRAPDLYHLPMPAMVGVGVSVKGCFVPPCPSPMPLLIDLKAIPEAPPGSDADRVARGLAPRGGPDAPPPAPAPAPAPAPVAPAPAETGVRPPESASPAVEPSGSASPPADPAPR